MALGIPLEPELVATSDCWVIVGAVLIIVVVTIATNETAIVRAAQLDVRQRTPSVSSDICALSHAFGQERDPVAATRHVRLPPSPRPVAAEP